MSAGSLIGVFVLPPVGRDPDPVPGLITDELPFDIPPELFLTDFIFSSREKLFVIEF